GGAGVLQGEALLDHRQGEDLGDGRGHVVHTLRPRRYTLSMARTWPRDDTRSMGETRLIDRHCARMTNWTGVCDHHPTELVHGHGRRVTDSNGKTYIDFFAGILTNALGYDVAEVSDAVRKQLDTGILHTSTLYLIRSQIELAEEIARLSGIPDAKVFF